MSNGRSARWCFTINNPITDQIFTALPDNVRFVVWQQERGAEGTVHLQGYIAFVNARTLKGVKQLLGDRAHCEIARGSEDQNTAYCTKEESRVSGPFQLGRAATPGKRTDLTEAAEKVLSTGSIRDVDPTMIIKYAKGLNALAATVKPAMRARVEVFCLCGKTGIGKTWNIFNDYPNVFRPLLGNSGVWWDGYDGEDAVLFDEFEGQIQITKMLQYLDPYPMKLEIKGGSVWANYTKVFITSNREPEDWYPGVVNSKPAQYAALARRVGVNTHFCFWADNQAQCSAKWTRAKGAMWTGPAVAAVMPVVPPSPVIAPQPSKKQCITIPDDSDDEEF